MSWITYKILNEGNTVKIFAYDSEIIIGCGEILVALDCADIINIEVHSEYRRRGIGGKIFKQLISYAIENNVETITLEVRKSNTPAIALYDCLGFVKISERVRYYSDGEDALIMQLKCS